MKKRVALYLALLLVLGGIMYFPAYAEETAKGLVRLQEAPKFQKENKVAVIVGVNTYDRSTGLKSLRYAASDAINLSNMLKNQGYTVRLLRNHEAGKYRIINAIQEVGKLLGGKGTFLFAYSGHGFAIGKENYLASYGTVLNNLSQSALPLSEVQQAIHGSGAKRAMLFIDACRNDPNIAGSKAVGNMGFVDSKSKGVKILYATEIGTVSWESSRLRHGVFSHFLIKALRGEAADANGIISFGTVKAYVQQHVSHLTHKEMPSVQLPFSNDNSFGRFVLGQTEQSFWNTQRQCHEVACYQNYLERYPQGKYVAQARRGKSQIKQQNEKRQRERHREQLQAQRNHKPIIHTTVPQPSIASKWKHPAKNICIKNGGKIIKGICHANWLRAKKICLQSKGKLSSIATLNKIVQNCKRKSSYSACYKKYGFNGSVEYWSDTSTKEKFSASVMYFPDKKIYIQSKDIDKGVGIKCEI
jgi:hypothetical protein